MKGAGHFISQMWTTLLLRFRPPEQAVEAAQIARMAAQSKRDSFSSVFFAGLVVLVYVGPFTDLPVPNTLMLYAWLASMIFFAPLLYGLSRYLKLSTEDRIAQLGPWRRHCLMIYAGNAALWGLFCFMVIEPSSQSNQAFTLIVYFGLTAVYAVHASAHLQTYTAMILLLFSLVLTCIFQLPGPFADALSIVLPFFIAFALLLGFDNNRTLTHGIEREIHQKTLLRDLEIARQRAVESNRAKSNFLAMMSHELRTPLNAIIGFADTMRSETFGPVKPAKYAGYVDDIQDSGRHLLALLNELLELSHIDAGTARLREETLPVEPLVQSVMNWVRDRADERSVNLRSCLEANLPDLRVDPVRLKQVILNLLTNAVKFTPAGGHVTLSAALDDIGRVMFEVRDTGIGIEPENLERIFEPFTQVSTGLLSAHDGVGLGLTITKRLVDLHGGTMVLTSEPGVGTVVRVFLPAERVMHASKQSDSEALAAPDLDKSD